MKKILNILTLISISLFLFGCSTTVFKQPVTVSTKSVVGNYYQDSGERVSFSKSEAMFLFIPVATLSPKKINEGFIQELNAARKRTLLDVQFYNSKGFSLFPLLVKTKYTIEGNIGEMRK